MSGIYLLGSCVCAVRGGEDEPLADDGAAAQPLRRSCDLPVTDQRLHRHKHLASFGIFSNRTSFFWYRYNKGFAYQRQQLHIVVYEISLGYGLQAGVRLQYS